MKKLLFLLSICINTMPICNSQTAEKTIELNQTVTGNATYIARDAICLKPGFTYKAERNNSFNAAIDESLQFPAEYLDSPPNTNRILDLSKTVGSLPGSASVGITGAATYQIPIEIAPGISGMQPSISLVYNSQSGNGLLGWGFNISGLSAISRVPQTIYFDGNASGIKNNSTDKYALDGNRLVSVNGTYGSDGTEYATETETFSKIYSRGSYGSNGPSWFEVKTKDGMLCKYGSNSGKIIYNNEGGKQSAMSWLLDHVENQTGQTISYQYENSGLCSYISKITYGDNSIEFFYDSRSDTMPVHFDGLTGNMDRVLRKITTRSEGKIYRQYQFEYTKDVYSRLVKITESNENGETFNPTIFQWDGLPGNAYLSTENISVSNSSLEPDFSKQSYVPMDINGDGLTDFIGFFPYKEGNSHYTGVQRYIAQKRDNGSIYFTDGTLRFTKLSASTSKEMEEIISNVNRLGGVLCGNVLDADKQNFVFPYYMYNSGSKQNIVVFNILTEDDFYTSNCLLSYSSELPAIAISDINNSGWGNILFIEKGKNSSGKYVLYIAEFTSQANQTYKATTDKFEIDLSGNPERIFAADFDGDGMNDIMVVAKNGYSIFWNKGGGLSSSFSNSDKTTGDSFNGEYSAIEIGDFNGDGLPDFILNERHNTNWHLALNTGKKSFEKKSLPQITAREESSTSKNDDKDHCFVVDFNGDGKSDIILSDSYYSDKTFISHYVLWYRSTGNDFELIEGTGEPYYKENALAKYFILGDFYGSGNTQLMFYGYNCFEYDSSETSKEQKWRLYDNPDVSSNSSGKIIAISNGLGHKTDFSYKFMTDKTIYTKGTGSTFPVLDIQAPLSVVHQVTQTNGVSVNGKFQKTYQYKNAKVHAQGKGFLGFMEVQELDNTLNLKTTTEYEYNTTYYNPSVKKQKTTTSANSEIASTEYTNAVKTISGKRFFPYVNKVVEKNSLTDISISKDITIDGNGNLTKDSITYGSDATIVSDYTYVHAGGNGVTPNKPNSITVKKTYTGQPAFTTKQEYFYNTKGILTQQIDLAQTTNERVVTDYLDINSLGLAKNVKETAGDRPSLTTSFEYDVKGRVVKTTNPLGLSSSTTYDYVGNVATSIDHLGNTTSYRYDKWGKLLQTSYPTGTSETQTLQWVASNDTEKPSNALYKITGSATNKPDHVTYYDILNRELRSVRKNISGKNVFVDNIYNSKGQLEKTTIPSFYKNDTLGTAYRYDSYGRLTTESNICDTVSITYAYDKRTTTTTNAAGQKSIKTVNSLGDLVLSKDDAEKEVKYVYHSSGQPLKITAADVVADIEYDHIGRQKSITDPSAGKKTYEYDTAGNIITETDARNKVISMIYDSYGRLEYKVYPEFTTTYVYNTDGTLKYKSSGNGNSTHYTYDRFGRVSTSLENISDGKSLKKTIAYNWDDISSVTYNSQSEQIASENYIYKNGYLHQIRLNNSTPIWQLDEENAYGQTTMVTTGPLTRTYGYDIYGLPTLRKAGSFENFSYSFNAKTVNLTWRKDNCYGRQENFRYDNLNRLTHYSGHTAVYDDKGNITQKNDVGTFEYKDPKIPYAVSDATLYSGTVPLRSQSATYTSFMRPASISENTDSGNIYYASFTYNGSEERVRMNLTKNGISHLKRYYISNRYEIDVIPSGTKEKLYLGGDAYSAPAVYVKQNSGSWNIYYICRDYLGSITHITNSSGSLVQELSYDAWGRLRNPSSQVTYTSETEPELFLGRGYTGHEHLAMFGLVNMNARLYDPVTGRFLSPDPFVQAPDFSQNFNRYSYCLNNPLKYTDPSGELFVIDDLIVTMAIGAVINTTIQGMSGNINSSGDFFKAMGVGALSGVAGGIAGQAVSSALGTATSFWSAVGQGALTGSAGGFAGGFISGAGNAWNNGASFGNGLMQGLVGGGIGTLTGGMIGGISGGLQFQQQEVSFRTAEAEMGFGIGEPIPTNDESLNRFTDYWYKSRNSGPFENVIDYTYDNKPANVIRHFSKNPKATAMTVAQYGSNGRTTGFSSVYFNNSAFASSRTLYLAIGHELVHVQQYAYLAGSTSKFLNDAKAVMEVGAYGWEYNSGNSSAIYSVSDWRGVEYNKFLKNNFLIGNHLQYNCIRGLPTAIPHFGPLPTPLIPLLRIP